MKHQNKIRRSLLFGFLLSPLLSACLAGPIYQDQQVYRTCDIEEDCLTGEACSEQGYCLPVIEPEGRIGIELVPSESQKDAQGGLVQTEFGPDELAFDESGALVVPYEPPETIEGSVSVPTAPLAAQEFSQFHARVTFWRASRIPGRPRVNYSSNLSFDMTNAPIDGMAVLQYSLSVPVGFTYQARAVPENGYETVVPPSGDVTLELFQAGQTIQQDFDFSADDFHFLEGSATDAMGEPLSGIEVQMTDAQGRRVSTVAVTSPQEGSFQIFFPGQLDTSEKYTLVLSPGDAVDMLLPKLEIPVQPGDSDDLVLDPIEYPPLRTERCSFQFRVVGQSSSGSQEPVAGAKVAFSTEFPYDAEGIASHSVEAVTDPDGRLSVQLISGANAEARQYRLAVLPSVDSPYAARVTTVDISGCGGTASTIQLSERTQVAGIVQSTTAGPVPNLTVSARPLLDNTDPQDLSPASMMLESGHAPSATSADDGSFYINLDPGRYNMELTPPAGSPLPRWLVTGITVEEGMQTKSIRINLPSPALLRGKVQAPSEIPMGGFVVRAYLVPPDCNKADWTGCSQPAFLLSESAVHNDGSFSLVVPDNL